VDREQETGNRNLAARQLSSEAAKPLNLQTSKPPFGFLNVYKPVGMTSHDVVAILRRITKVKQIGHTGTLDPFAQGVLPIAIGKATRLIEFLDDDKEYLAEIAFGMATNTYDLEGEAISQCHSEIAASQVQKALKSFEGEIEQIPPIYSAIKVNGKKLYEYARKGEEVKIEPRKVFIEKIELKNFDYENQKAQVLIKCSKGTYIRSIAHDLGQNLGVGAHLSKLIRTQAGKFLFKDSTPLAEFEKTEDIEKKLIYPLEIINLPKIIINEEEQDKIMVGQFIENKKDNKGGYKEDDLLILVYNNKISAIAYVNENTIKVKKGFSEGN